MRISLCLLLAFLVLPAREASAQSIPAGSDLWTVPAGSSFDLHFDGGSGGTPLPAGFFGAGSDAFSGVILLHGRPLEGTPSGGPSTIGIPGQADAITRRVNPASISSMMCPVMDTVPIEIVALSLVSSQPIVVTFSGGTITTEWEVRVGLSTATPQTQGSMTILKQHRDGGVFSSMLPVRARLVFTRCVGTAGLSPRVIDPSAVINLQAVGNWAFNTGGLPIATSPGGLVDHDCDPGSAQVPYPATTIFFGGVHYMLSVCGIPNPSVVKTLTIEQEPLAQFGLLPPCLPPGFGVCFGDGTGTPCPCGNNGAPGNGCGNQANPLGARLFGVGEARVSADTFVLRCEGTRPSSPLIFYQGNVLPAVPAVFGDGLRCIVGSGIRRFPDRLARCARSHQGAPLGDVPISISGAIPPAGATRYYQSWYRDAVVYCTPDFFNLSNGYQVTWLP